MTSTTPQITPGTLSDRLGVYRGDGLDAWMTAVQECGHCLLPADNELDAWQTAKMICDALGIDQWYLIARNVESATGGTWYVQVVGAETIDWEAMAEQVYQLRLERMTAREPGLLARLIARLRT